MADFTEVKCAVFEARAKWSDIGLKLGIRKSDLDNIQGSDNSSRLGEMLTIWLKRRHSMNPTWESLVEALKSDMVDQMDVAEMIGTYVCHVGLHIECYSSQIGRK